MVSAKLVGEKTVNPSIVSLVFLCACIGLLMPACAQTPTPTVETLEFIIIADPSTAPLMEKLTAAYLVERPHVTIELDSAPNAERALEVVQAGNADLAAVSGLPEDAKTSGALWYRPVARDAIVIVTNPSNPVSGLTLLQLRSIFQGQTLAWTDLGGPAVDILPVSREDGSGTRLSFESLVMGRRDVSPTAVLMPSHKAVVEFVSSTPGAIGYVASAWLVPSVNLLAVEGIAPSPASVNDGRYPLSHPYYLAARAEPNDGTADLVTWVVEGEGQDIIRRDYAGAP